MRARCRKNHPNAKNYFDRGIVVCERWDDFSLFIKDMGLRPSDSHIIDRINNNLGYYPDNCRWATPIQQARNTRKNHMINIGGQEKCLSEWAQLKGISKTALRKSIVRYGKNSKYMSI